MRSRGSNGGKESSTWRPAGPPAGKARLPSTSTRLRALARQMALFIGNAQSGMPTLRKKRKGWRSYFRNFPATNSGRMSSNLLDSQLCSSDLHSAESDTKRTPSRPDFDQQIFDFANNSLS